MKRPVGERDLVWVTLDGRRMRVCDMTPDHLANCLRMIMRKQTPKFTRKRFARKVKHIQLKEKVRELIHRR